MKLSSSTSRPRAGKARVIINDGEARLSKSVCKMDADSGEIIKSESILVKPVHSEISAFCTRLTSITPQMVERDGISLKEACEKLEERYLSKQLTWASYGAYDRTMLTEQCTRFGVAYPMSRQHINVKVFFSDAYKLGKGIGMPGALRMLSLPLEGTHHRGIDDAKNIAKILYRLMLD